MANTSIKIELYHIPVNELSSNEKLGYLLLKLKEAQTIDPSSNDRVKIIELIFYVQFINTFLLMKCR